MTPSGARDTDVLIPAPPQPPRTLRPVAAELRALADAWLASGATGFSVLERGHAVWSVGQEEDASPAEPITADVTATGMSLTEPRGTYS